MSMLAHNNTSPSCSSPTSNDPHDADLEPLTTNDSNPSISSANTSATNKRKTFPRFLVVEGLGANKTLRNVNSTILDKTIDGATSVSIKRGWMGRSAWWKSTMRLTSPTWWNWTRLVTCLSRCRPIGAWTMPKVWSGSDKLLRALQMKT